MPSPPPPLRRRPRAQTRHAPREFSPQIYEGLQLPKGKERPIRTSGIRVLKLKPVMTNDEIKAREGSYCTEKDAKFILDEDADVYGIDPSTGAEKLLARFRKNVIPHHLVRQGWEAFYQTAAASRNRGAAAGPIDLKSNYWKKRKPTDITKWSARYMQDGKLSKMRVNNNVYSSVLGYFEQTPFMGLPCRLTSYTQKYFKNYKHGLPYICAIDKCFKSLIPDKHRLQHKAASEKPFYRVENTAFSSITINRNFRTALHLDDGDFKQGYGNLTVIERGQYTGGATIFPQYGVGFNVRTGDFLAMDVHEWHCNTEMTTTAAQEASNRKLPKIHFEDASTGTLGSEKSFTRISFVCYLREKLRGCKEGDTRAYYKKINFDLEHGPAPRQRTRKVGRTERAQ